MKPPTLREKVIWELIRLRIYIRLSKNKLGRDYGLFLTG